MLNKKNTDKKIFTQHQQLQPLPPQADKTIKAPHEYRGLCSVCHPTATGVTGTRSNLPKKSGMPNLKRMKVQKG